MRSRSNGDPEKLETGPLDQGGHIPRIVESDKVVGEIEVALFGV